MENKVEIQDSLVTLKAEFVNEIEFEQEFERIRAYSSETKVVHPYVSEYKATVSVKVGNTVKQITLGENHEYISSEGRYGDDDYKESYYKDYIGLHYREINPFQSIIDAGIEIDFSDIFVQYEIMLKEAKRHEMVIKRAKNINRIRARKAEYQNSWPIVFKSIIEKDKNKKIQDAFPKTKFKPISEKNFVVENDSLSLKLIYRGFDTGIWIEGGSYVFQDAYEVPKDAKREYTHHRQITNGKRRKAKREGTTFLRFTEAVDNYIARRESQLDEDTKARLKRKEEKEYLEKVSGYPVTILVEDKSRYDYRRIYQGSYKVFTYKIVEKKTTSKYDTKYEGITIDFIADFEWKDGEHVEVPGTRTFSIKNLDKLSKEQFKQILDILLKGKELGKVINE